MGPCGYNPAKIQTLICNIVASFHIAISNLYNSTLPFTIQCAYFKCSVVRTCDILIQCSMCLYGVKCAMLPTQSNILVQFLYSQSICFFCFQISSFNMQHSCLSMQFWYSVWMLLCRVRYACYKIQYSCLDIELHARVTWPWVGRPLDKVCGLKVIARGVAIVPHVPGDIVMAIVVLLGKHLQTTGRPHFVAWQSIPSIKIGLLQQTIIWYKIRHAGEQAYYYCRTGTLQQRPVTLDWLGLFVFMSQCGNNIELASSMADFVPCDRLLQKAYCDWSLLSWGPNRLKFSDLFWDWYIL